MPDVAGLPVDEAAERLAAAGLVLAQPSRERTSEPAPAGTVVDVVEKGKELPGPPGDAGRVAGSRSAAVPDVSGTPEPATAALQALGLVVAPAEDYSESSRPGRSWAPTRRPATRCPRARR